MIREIHNQRTPDPIDLAVGSNQYAIRYNIPGMREALLGPYSRDLVPVSRFYPKRLPPQYEEQLVAALREGREPPAPLPPVVVDFEHARQTFYVEEKRRFCHSKGIIYVPVFMNEILQPSAFAERLQQETAALLGAETAEREALPTVGDPLLEELLESAEVTAAVAQEARRRAQAQNDAEHQGRLVGIAFTSVLRKHQLAVLAELRERARNGSLGTSLRADQLSHAVGR